MDNMDNMNKAFIETLENLGYEPQPYSGRGMYGEECVGIVTDNPQELYACLAEAHDATHIRKAVTDSMGMDIVVYWPNEKWIDE